MKCDIVIVRKKDGIEVYRTDPPLAQAEAHPDIGDFFENILDEIGHAITSQAFLCILGAVAGTIVPASRLLTAYLAAKQISDQTNDIFNNIINSSNWQCSARQEITLDESDEFDEIYFGYHAQSDDDIKFCRHLTEGIWSMLINQGLPATQVAVKENDKSYHYAVSIKTSSLEEGLYPFIFGAVDSGSHYDVAAFSSLTLNWRKKPKANATSLRQLSESIDPPSSSRSLREVSNILDIDPPSLRRCCEEQANCRSIQASQPPLRIFEQNTALFPQHIEIPILGQVPFFALYKGTSRQAAIESFIAYLQAEQPDIVGLCEVWVPEERTYLRSCLSEIYPFDAAFYAEGPIGGAPGFTTIMDNGGLLPLSRWPIMARDQIK